MVAFETYNGILGVRANALIGDFIDKPLYDYYLQKGKFKSIRRGCRETPALIEFSTLPDKLKIALKGVYGEDVKKLAEKDTIRGMYSISQEALAFYRKYRTDEDKSLSEAKIEEYTINASLICAINKYYAWRSSFVKAKSGKAPKRIWEQIAAYTEDLKCGVEPIKHTLPRSHRRLQEIVKSFGNNDYAKLISGKLGNKNTEKVQPIAQSWVLARWMDNVNKVPGTTELLVDYNEKAPEMGWKPIKSAQTLINFLYKEEIKNIWIGHRHGEQIYKEKYIYQHSTIMPSMRDSLWYSDGTKLNLYYRYENENGKTLIGTKQVYEVMDVYSEVFLGYHISTSENFEAQFKAYKMAFNFAKHKPYQITYDNQGGHKKGEAGDFFGRLAHLNIRTQPYNGKSKTIESAFGRFQQHYMKRVFGFTGQNITATSLESRANMEFIMANIDKLPTLEEAMQQYKRCRTEWNNAKHHSINKTRLQAYQESSNDKSIKLDIMDLIELFYVNRPEPITCTAYGLLMRENKQKYNYMVTIDDNKPDIYWLQNNIDKKFYIKYDPENMDIIFLYEKSHDGLRFVCPAQTKTKIHRGKQEQEAWEPQWIKDIELAVKEMRVKTYQNGIRIMKEWGCAPVDYGFRTPAIKGIQTSKSAKRMKRKELVAVECTEALDREYGQYTKALSNKDRFEYEEDTIEDIYKNL